MKQLPKLTVEIKNVIAERDVIETKTNNAEYKTYNAGSITYTAELARGGFVEITAAEFSDLSYELANGPVTEEVIANANAIAIEHGVDHRA